MSNDRDAVRELSGRLSARLAEAIETDQQDRSGGAHRTVRDDRPRLELMLGRWLAEEVAAINQRRLQHGLGVLDPITEQSLRSQAYAATIGAGPLDTYFADPEVEEIDVNSHLCTWVSYADGRKVDLGQLWESADDLTAFQQRVTLSMGLSESRLDEQSPMVTLQAPDGARVVMVLGGPGRNGISTHPRLSVRRFTVDRVGLHGLAARGLFPDWLVPQLEALVVAGMTILVSGGPGAGKTTLLKELLGAVPPGERIVTIEKGLLELRLGRRSAPSGRAGAVHPPGQHRRARSGERARAGRADPSAEP